MIVSVTTEKDYKSLRYVLQNAQQNLCFGKVIKKHVFHATPG